MNKIYKHLVLFKVKAPLAENTAKLATALKNLEGKIPEIEQWQVVQKDATAQDQAAGMMDLALISGFKTTADLESYKIHPEHQKVVELCKEISPARSALDYWEEVSK